MGISCRRLAEDERHPAAHLVEENLVAAFDVQIGNEDGPPCIRDEFASPHPEPSGIEVLESLVLLGEDVEFFHERFYVRIRVAAFSQRIVSRRHSALFEDVGILTRERRHPRRRRKGLDAGGCR